MSSMVMTGKYCCYGACNIANQGFATSSTSIYGQLNSSRLFEPFFDILQCASTLPLLLLLAIPFPRMPLPLNIRECTLGRCVRLPVHHVARRLLQRPANVLSNISICRRQPIAITRYSWSKRFKLIVLPCSICDRFVGNYVSYCAYHFAMLQPNDQILLAVLARRQ